MSLFEIAFFMGLHTGVVFAATVKEEYFTSPMNTSTLYFSVWNGLVPQEFINISMIQEVPNSVYRHYDLSRIRDCIPTEGRVQCRFRKSECREASPDLATSTGSRPRSRRNRVTLKMTLVPTCTRSKGPTEDWVSLMVRISCPSQTRMECQRSIASVVPTVASQRKPSQPSNEAPPPVFCYTRDVVDVRASSQYDARTGARQALARRRDNTEWVSSLQFANASFKPQTLDIYFGHNHTISVFSFKTSRSGLGISDGPSSFVLQGCHNECAGPDADWADIMISSGVAFLSTTETKEFHIPRSQRASFRNYRLLMRSTSWKDKELPWGYFALRQIKFCGRQRR